MQKDIVKSIHNFFPLKLSPEKFVEILWQTNRTCFIQALCLYLIFIQKFFMFIVGGFII